MDITSYLLGKNSSGGGGGGESNNVLVDTSLGYINYGGLKSLIKSVDTLDWSNKNTMNSLFAYCGNLETAPQITNTSDVTDMYQTFFSCESLKNVPIYDTSKVTNFTQTFALCSKLSDESLDNILKMCINATSYTGTKTLVKLSIVKSYYPVSRIEALPSYQAFLDAGWTIGY